MQTLMTSVEHSMESAIPEDSLRKCLHAMEGTASRRHLILFFEFYPVSYSESQVIES